MSDKEVSLKTALGLVDMFNHFIEKTEHLLNAQFDDEDVKLCVFLDVINTAQRNSKEIWEKIKAESNGGERGTL